MGPNKGLYASKNSTFKYDEEQNLTVEGANCVTPLNRQNYKSHIIKVEENMLEIDNLAENTIESHIIKVEENMWEIDNLAEITIERLCFYVNTESCKSSKFESDTISEI